MIFIVCLTLLILVPKALDRRRFRHVPDFLGLEAALAPTVISKTTDFSNAPLGEIHFDQAHQTKHDHT